MTPQQHAEQLAKNGQCVVCETASKRLVRGLCPKHFARFKSWLSKLDASSHDAYERELIEAGALLPKRQGQSLAARFDKFAEVAQKFLTTAEPPADVVESVAADVERVAVDLEKAKKATSATGKTSGKPQ